MAELTNKKATATSEVFKKERVIRIKEYYINARPQKDIFTGEMVLIKRNGLGVVLGLAERPIAKGEIGSFRLSGRSE